MCFAYLKVGGVFMSLPINVMFDSGVDRFEEKAIIEGLVGAVFYFPSLSLRLYGSKVWAKGDYGCADWYIGMARKMLRHGHMQYDAGSLLELLRNEPWQSEPHIDVFFTSKDLTMEYGGEYLNFCFGVASGRATIQSVARFRGLPDADRKLAIEAVVRHELGHIFGLAADLRRPHTVDNLGAHCTNPGCIMRQALTVDEWVRNARESARMGMIYCPECMKDAKKIRF